MNLSLLLTMAADGMSDRAAVGRRGESVSYGELLDRSSRIAEWIDAQHTDTVAQVGVNSDVVPALLFGAAIAGRRFAPLNYRLADDRLAALVGRLAPVLVIADDDAARRISGDGVVVAGLTRLESEVAASPPLLAVDERSPDDVAVLLYTSGSTGEPKAAVLRHKHLVSYVISTVEFMSAGESDAALISVPPYHIAGISAILSSVYAGRRIVYLPTFDPAEWVHTVNEEGITHAMLIPTMLARILDVLGDEPLPTLRHLAYGGGRMPLPVIERALEQLPQVAFVNAYGLTETSSTICLLGPEDHRLAHRAADPTIRRRLGSVGRPVPGIELEIRDEDGHRVADGDGGEVWVRGEQVAGEYVDVAEHPEGGWFRTKDIASVDTAGFVYLQGRSDDVIVRGGENLSPGEIEDVLVSHPAIGEAAVVGLADDEWGQVPVAFVVATGLAPSEPELQLWVRERLRSSRTPTRIIFLEELPYTSTGKVLRRLLRGQLESSL